MTCTSEEDSMCALSIIPMSLYYLFHTTPETQVTL